jgi:hypothetical protein
LPGVGWFAAMDMAIDCAADGFGGRVELPSGIGVVR